MSVFWAIVQAEVLRRLRSRPFVIGTVIGALGLVTIVVLPALLEHRAHAAAPLPPHGGSDESLAASAFALVTALYIAIVLNAQTISASVAEEKTSRIAEILVAAVDPTVLLCAKIVAAFGTAAVQLAVWALVAAATRPYAAASGLPIAVDAPLLAAFAVAFVIGLAQYALLFAAAASLINRTEDLGSVIGPLMLPALGGFFGAQFAVVAPNAPVVAVLAQLPLIAPFVMIARIAATRVSPGEIGLSFAINAAAAVAIALVAGRVYRVGLLLYGRPPSVRQVLAVLRS